MSDSKIIVSVDQVESRQQSRGDTFDAQIKDLSDQTQLEQLGVRSYEIPPGKTAWPFHCHLANEEVIFIQQGSGTLRYGDREAEVESGDMLAFPPNPDYAHQLINTSDVALQYLCVSTMNEPDAILYPDSNKIGILSGDPPGGSSEKRNFEKYLDNSKSLDYWDGEVERE